MHHLAGVVAVAVLDGVDDRLANRHADPMHRVFVKPEPAAQVVAYELDEIEHVERAAEFQAYDITRRTHHSQTTGAASAARPKWITHP